MKNKNTEFLVSDKKMFETRMPQKPVRSDGKVKEQSGQDIVELILKDHEPLKKQIKILKNPELSRAKKEPALEIFVSLLTAHAKAEERSLYVQLKEEKNLRMEGLEGDTEHKIADELVQKINQASDDDVWSAKVKVLAELVEHHIKDEEDALLPDVEKELPLSLRKAIGFRYVALKEAIDGVQRLHSPSQIENRDRHLH